jgi:hypothetical protein
MFCTETGKLEIFATILGFAGLTATSRISFRSCKKLLALVAAVGEIAYCALAAEELDSSMAILSMS